MSFVVLFVCTGNICRSPVAERLFNARVLGAAVAVSAGTHAMTGWPIDGPSALALRELGVEPGGHAAQPVTPELTDGADLILTATTEHRSKLVQTAPLLFRKTFTLREFARLGTALEPAHAPLNPDGMRRRVTEIADQRGQAAAPAPGGDEIGDPYGAERAVARSCAAMISAAIDAALSALGAGKGRRP